MSTRQYLLTCGAAVAVVLAPSLVLAQPQAGDRPVRVMSYNIKHGQTTATCTQPAPVPGQPPFPDCALDLQASIAVIRSYDPDIVAMQEIDRFWARSDSQDEPAVIAQGLGFAHTCYAPNLDHGPDNHATVPHQYGTLIVSRFPILECSNQLLRREGNTEQRGLTRALINVRGVPLQLFNTHLHTVAADRVLQVEDIAAALDAAPPGPKVLMGDFNARATSTELALIAERLDDTRITAGQPDTANPDGFTSPAGLAREPTSRIDYVFASPDIDARATFVPITPATRLAADHYPVVADLALPGSAVGIGNVKKP